VRRLLPFLACLMLVLTGWSGMAHAAEAAGGSMGGVEFTVHAPGDGDEVPADGDNALPHHHGICHGHDVGEPARTPSPSYDVTGGLIPPGMPDRMLVAADGHVALRPPKA
jgi:hypothetical protein